MGNVVSTSIGITAARMFDNVTVAASVAVAVAIAVMMALRCVHPPGGACALFTAVGSAAVAEQGYAFALWPVGVNTLVLLGVAALVNNLTGRPYPHVPPPPPPTAGHRPRAPASGSACRPRTSGRRSRAWTAGSTSSPATS